jgi:putative transposase
VKLRSSQRTSWLSSLLSQQDITGEESTKQLAYCRKVRFYPTQEHKALLEKCFGATRYLTNKALDCIKQGQFSATSNAISLRNNLRYQDKYLEEQEMWLKDIPYDTRDCAIRQLASNFKTIFSQLKKKLISHFSMSFKSKKNPTQVCFVNKKAFINNVGNKKLFVRRVKKSFTFKEKVDDFVHGTITIVRIKNRYYMCFPMKRKQLNVRTPYQAVALDPGVRTFQTFYSEEGLCGKIGDQESLRLKHILELEDKLKSKISTLKNIRKSTRYNLRKRCFFLRTKVKNIVADLHRKTCHWLTTTFKHVFLPSFDVRHMVKKSRRNIRKSTVRAMLALSHYSFKERLLHMATYRGCKVYICDESYTSKTCGCCGNMNDTLGGNKVFVCSKCGISIDRDYNGARNIYLRNIQSHG